MLASAAVVAEKGAKHLVRVTNRANAVISSALAQGPC